NVFGKDVLVEWIASGAVNEKISVLAVATGPLGEELPAAFADLLGFAGGFQLIARPKNGTLGWWIEAVGIEHGALIVITEQDDLAFHDQIDTFARIRAVADHVTEAVNLADILFFNVFEDCLKRLKVAVNVADNRLHAWLPRFGLQRRARRSAPRTPAIG